jgi:hypothetical protein
MTTMCHSHSALGTVLSTQEYFLHSTSNAIFYIKNINSTGVLQYSTTSSRVVGVQFGVLLGF